MLIEQIFSSFFFDILATRSIYSRSYTLVTLNRHRRRRCNIIMSEIKGTKWKVAHLISILL